MSAAPLRDSDPGPDQRPPTIEYVVARALLDVATLDAGLAAVLQAIGDGLGWAAAAVWMVDLEHGCLRRTQAWVGPSPEAHVAPASPDRLAPGQGLAGSIWSTPAVRWFAPAAAVAGSHSRHPEDDAALAFPIELRGEVVAVLEFRGPSLPPHHQDFARALEVVRSQIGLFIDRHRAHDALTSLFDLSPDMLCVAGFDGYLKRVNPAWEQTLGYTSTELLERPYESIMHPDDIAATRREAIRLFSGAPVVHFENRYLHKDGSIRWLMWAAAPPPKHAPFMYAAARDITEHKAAEALRARTTNLELLDELLATVPDSGDVSAVFERIAAIAGKILPHDALGLPVLQPDGQHVRRYASVGLKLVDTLETIVVPDAFLDPGWEHDLIDDVVGRDEAHNRLIASMGFRSALRVPIRLEGRLVALLAFVGRTPGMFTTPDILIARRIADRLALTLAHDRELAAAKRADEAVARAAQLEARVRALTDELDSRTGYRRVIGGSPQWHQVLTQATQVAATDTTVLLLGESGTGKEVAARFVHRGSARRHGPFVALNCAALPEQLLEAELFGYERGAYTGATQSKPGQLEQAAGGTLFLDEVAEMSPSAQAKFLRVLQEREFQRLGGTRVLRTDARIVAATNRDLSRAIANGQFREDLYYRLNVFAIKLPALRERRDDVLPLSEAFLIEIGRSIGRPPAGIARDARALLVEYHWPGNVRELRNILERAAILCDGGLITAEHLALSAPVPAAVLALAPNAVAATSEASPAAAPPPSGDLQSMERAMIEQALQTARFNKSKAAKALGLTRHQLYIRMRKYGFE